MWCLKCLHRHVNTPHTFGLKSKPLFQFCFITSIWCVAKIHDWLISKCFCGSTMSVTEQSVSQQGFVKARGLLSFFSPQFSELNAIYCLLTFSHSSSNFPVFSLLCPYWESWASLYYYHPHSMIDALGWFINKQNEKSLPRGAYNLLPECCNFCHVGGIAVSMCYRLENCGWKL